jgi:signal peptidase I
MLPINEPLNETLTPPSPSRAEQLRWLLTETLQTILLAVIIFIAINFATARILVESVSMQPTLYESDFVLVNRMTYLFSQPGRKDVIVFNPPIENQIEPYIKRVIGLPGDEVRIANGSVFVNGEPLKESYLAAPPAYSGVWIVPDGMLFVLGDNRNNSSDSHHWGMVAQGSIIGKAEFVYWPYSHWKVLNPSTAAAAGN